MQLLQLSDSGEQIEKVNLIKVGCGDGFYRKIAGLKGPKSLKELESLEGWIKHFLNSEEREPFVLAHLLLVKLLCGIQMITVMDLEVLNSRLLYH